MEMMTTKDLLSEQNASRDFRALAESQDRNPLACRTASIVVAHCVIETFNNVLYDFCRRSFRSIPRLQPSSERLTLLVDRRYIRAWLC